MADASLVWMLGEATAAGLKLDEKSRKEVATIVANSESASAAQPNDLRKRCWYWRLPLPRMELDNSVYPPYRLPKCLPTGIRKPAEHAEEDLEEGPKILLHASVGKRSQVGTLDTVRMHSWDGVRVQQTRTPSRSATKIPKP